MALTSEEQKMLRQAKKEGLTKEQALGRLVASRETVIKVDKEPLLNRFTDTIGLGGATDVFGSLLARQGIGTDVSKETTQRFVEKPTGKQIAGAVAQTAAIPAGAALTGGGSLAGQIAAGAGLGYVYDVGSDLAEGKTGPEAFVPGAETIAGAAIPPVFRGASAALRGVGTAASKVPTSGVVQRAKEVAQRIPRATRRISENLDEASEIAKRKQTGNESVVKALDEGINTETIDFVEQFDEPTKQAASDMLDLAEKGRGADLPQTIPGKFAGEQLEIVTKQRKEIGRRIGEFSDSLSNEKVDITPTLRNLRLVLDQNGIRPFRDGLRFENVSLTPKQENLVQEMYDLATRNVELSPKQIHQMDQLFSKLQREARFEGIDNVFVKVPTAEGIAEKNIYKVFRDVFSQQLDDIAEQAGRGDIKELNREYRTLRNLQDNVEDTIVRQSKHEGVNVDPSESASVALRRLFSTAQSRGEYREIYDQLDAMSRALGYEGPRADTLMDFYLTDMKPLYPDTVPKTSFEGGIRGAVGSIIERVSQVGAPNIKDQQKALKSLLESI